MLALTLLLAGGTGGGSIAVECNGCAGTAVCAAEVVVMVALGGDGQQLYSASIVRGAHDR